MTSSVKRTLTGANTYNFTNGRKGDRRRGGIIEILDFDNHTRVDVYQTSPGVRVNLSAHDADGYTRTLAAVSQRLWAAEGEANEPLSEEDYREVAREALGVCRFTGRLNCAERGCELHYMEAPCFLLEDTYEGQQVKHVLDGGPNEATGGTFALKVTGGATESKWLRVNANQLTRIARILAENPQ